MAVYNDEDLEIMAIVKCSSALSILDDKTRNRVLRLLLEKYNVIDSGNTFFTTNTEQLTPTCLPESAESTKNISPISSLSEVVEHNEEIPSIYQLITTGNTKSESDILLMVVYNKSNFGTIPIERQTILEGYKEYEVETDSRRKNLTPNLERLVKAKLITAITKTKFAITKPQGLKQVELIIAGDSSPRVTNK